MKLFKDINLGSRDYLLVRLDTLMGVEPGTGPLENICCLYLWVPLLGNKFLQIQSMWWHVRYCCKWLRLLPYAFLNSDNSQEVENTEITMKLPVFFPLNFISDKEAAGFLSPFFSSGDGQ